MRQTMMGLAPALSLFLTLIVTLALPAPPVDAAEDADKQVRAVDDSGREVVLAAPADRLVALSPHLVEIVFEVGAGDRLVGVSAHSDFPPGAQEIERLGDAFRVDFERLVALKPDLVLVWGSGNAAQTLDRLSDLGIPGFVSEPRSLEQVRSTFVRIGRLVDRAERGRAVAAAFTDQWQRIGEIGRSIPPRRVFVQLDASPLYTVNGEHLISEVLALCGAENIFADLPVLAPAVSVEAVIAEDPDVMIGSAAIPDHLFPGRWLDFPQLRATAENAFLRIDPNLMHRQSSRILQGAERVCGFLADFGD